MTQSSGTPALTAWAHRNLSPRFRCNIVWICQWTQAHSFGDEKVRTFICTPTVSDTMDKSKQRKSTQSRSQDQYVIWPWRRYPHAWIVIVSPRTSESPLFFWLDSNPWVSSNGPVGKQPDGPSLSSYQIIFAIHQACLLDPLHSSYLGI